VLPDLSISLSEIEKGEATPEEKLLQKEHVLQEYSQKADRIHTVQQLPEIIYTF
jgi:preprotein translocase subunit SecA